MQSPLVASIRSPERRAHWALDRLPRNWAAIADQVAARLDALTDFPAFGLDHPTGVARKPVLRAATNIVAKSVGVSSTPRLVFDALTRWGDA